MKPVTPRLPVRSMSLWLLGALLMLSGGCATLPFERTELTPVPPSSAAALTGGLWSSSGLKLLVRQSALFELQGMRVPMVGVMQLDLGRKRARLVGMNDMGVKLYDISVAADSHQAHFVLPELARYPGFAEAVAASVRRIFLAPNPAADDLLQTAASSYLLSRDNGACGKLRFTLGGAGNRLLETSCRGPLESWRVRYYRYRESPGIFFPGGIVLEDDRAGYRLTLWIESVGEIDE
jgi:hypothetical protein